MKEKSNYAGREILVRQHLNHLVSLCITLRVLITVIVLLASYLPAFDSSADILLADKDPSLLKRWTYTSLRWDTFHFLHIAQKNYQFEYEWAFLPGVPFILCATGWIVDFLTRNVDGPSTYNMLLGHFLLSSVISCETVRTLYLLTMEHTQRPALALLSGYLFLLSSSPTTAHLAPYTEPWFALFSYKGMLHCAQKRWFYASASFALASMFRSNGILLSCFLVWGMVAEPFLVHRRVKPRLVIECIFFCVLLSLPFAFHQLSGYLAFCTHPTASIQTSWCSDRLPLIYAHVQSKYWNGGFLRYWTIQQLPNFLIASPVLFLLSISSTTHVFHVLPLILAHKPESDPNTTLLMLTPSTLPHAIHAFFLTCMLLFGSNTQIILRLASSMPFTYWSAIRLFFEHPKWARTWITWSIIWGATSVVLWTAFLPPA